jgi:hypothetical protein
MDFAHSVPLECIWGKVNHENGRNHTSKNGFESNAWEGAQANYGQADAVAHRPPNSQRPRN